VPVSKNDGAVRFCGDFKVTLNPALCVDKYPIQRIEDLFASLAGGQCFSKLDLSNAYLQMEVEEKSRELLTISTQKGLFRFNRLPFGVASPALFQKAMDQVLLGLPYTVDQCFPTLFLAAHQHCVFSCLPNQTHPIQPISSLTHLIMS